MEKYTVVLYSCGENEQKVIEQIADIVGTNIETVRSKVSVLPCKLGVSENYEKIKGLFDAIIAVGGVAYIEGFSDQITFEEDKNTQENIDENGKIERTSENSEEIENKHTSSKHSISSKRKVAVAFFSSILAVIGIVVVFFGAGKNDSTKASDFEPSVVDVPEVLSEYSTYVFLETKLEEMDVLIKNAIPVLEYWNDNDFNTIEDIYVYESMWQELVDEATLIYESFLEYTPASIYAPHWTKIQTGIYDCASSLSLCTNLDANNDGVYTGDEMAERLRTGGGEFVDAARPVIDLLEDVERKKAYSDYKSSNDSASYKSTEQCVECGDEASKKYTNPFTGENESYCNYHYNEIVSMIGEMELDVGTGSQSKHTCEECSREGTHVYHSFTGITEYYCTVHYEELKELMASIGLDLS